MLKPIHAHTMHIGATENDRVWVISAKIANTYFHTSPFVLRLGPSQIPNAGFGVFTDSPIPAGARIDEYHGLVRDHGGLYALQIYPGCTIDGSVWPRCYMAILNDCSYIAPQYIRRKKRRIDVTPAAYYDAAGTVLTVNCEFVVCETERRAFVHALVDIPVGAELFVSYGKEYWKN